MANCIVHYDSLDTSSDKLVQPKANTFETLLECKKIRESLGGENHHIDQCSKIPDNLGEIEYFYHRKCFQKFVYAKALLKRKASQDGDEGSSSKLQRSTRKASQSAEATSSRGLFLNICMICKKKDVKVKGVRQSLSKIVTDTAESTLKEAAIVQNDLEMMTAVAETDLKAKEFQKHEKCYLDYTRVVRKKPESKLAEDENDDVPLGDYNTVLALVDIDIIGGQQCLSMETLMTKYSGNIGTKQSRYKLKERLKKSFGDKIVFLQAEYHIPQVVISRECLHNQMISGSSSCLQQFAIKRAASFLQESVLKFVEEAEPLSWPPTVESLASRERQYPELLQLFYKELLSSKGSHHATAERVDRLTDSFCQDIIHAVSKGKFLTTKHASLGLGLHSMTGEKTPITLLARLGHSISYDAINEIETAQAELVEHFQSVGLNLPLQPVTQGSKVSISVLQRFEISLQSSC